MKKKRILKFIAVYLLLNFVLEIFSPAIAFALSGGPSQPEVQSFEPVNTTEMVDLFSGDFVYNIPLLDVEGYPVNISYHSGITMEQESSWTGLGWNINPGVINRQMRGLPDEFDGDAIYKEFNTKADLTYDLELIKGEPELLGLEIPIRQITGIKYNNYAGLSTSKGYSLSTNLTKNADQKGGFCMDLSITSSSDGLAVDAALKYKSTPKDNKYSGVYSLGGSFNSEVGLKNLSFGMSFDKNTMKNQSDGSKKFSVDKTSSIGSVSLITSGFPTMSPPSSMPNYFYNVTASFKGGVDLFGIDGLQTIKAAFTESDNAISSKNYNAYGYFNLQNSKNTDADLLDFNREKEGVFTRNSPALPLTNMTYDLLSVSGQGVGGLYRTYRSDVGFMRDPEVYSRGGGGSLGLDLAGGQTYKWGADGHGSYTSSYSGYWKDGNQLKNITGFTDKSVNSIYEPYYIKEFGDKTADDDDYMTQNFNCKGQVRHFDIEMSKGNSLWSTASGIKQNIRTSEPGCKTSPITFKRSQDKRKKRAENLSFLTINEAKRVGLEKSIYNTKMNGKPGHHIGEVTVLKSDGGRYVYGLPAYNTSYKEASFAVGTGTLLTSRKKVHADKGLVEYGSDDASRDDNNRGKDHYYSSETVSPYAHSYFLTAVLSSDYVDIDNIGGPSKNDMGNYTKFNYVTNPSPTDPTSSTTNNYKWRSPFPVKDDAVSNSSAYWNSGLKSSTEDDKANYIYGEKEISLLRSIETKNFIAIFNISPKLDGAGVASEHDKGLGASSFKLDNIKLYFKSEYDKWVANPTTVAEPVPIKTVHFEYDYSLCKGIDNSFFDPSVAATTPNNSNLTRSSSYINEASGSGKLTLKKIFFTFRNSEKARFSPYTFDYGNNNKDYQLKNIDRWGNYKEYSMNADMHLDPAGIFSTFYKGLNVKQNEYKYDSPYVDQNQSRSVLDDWSSTWELKEISLPSGGKLKINYEADDYAYVQDKPAMEMVKVAKFGSIIAGVLFESDDLYETPILSHDHILVDISDDPEMNIEVLKSKYLNGIDNLYYKVLVNMNRKINVGGVISQIIFPDHPSPIFWLPRYEYVQGYAEVDKSAVSVQNSLSKKYLAIKIKKVNRGDSDYSMSVSPIVKSATQYCRINLQDVAKDNYDPFVSGDLTATFCTTLASMSFSKSLEKFVEGPTTSLMVDNKCKQTYLDQSYVRLSSPTKKKVGGGSRVKSIEMDDVATDLNSSLETSKYIQSFDYTINEGGNVISSGVASYEPMIGGDEIPQRQPIFFKDHDEKFLIPDDKFYMEQPIGESYFPSPGVGYSQVTVINKGNVPDGETNVNHSAGKVIHKFYTSFDFPTHVTTGNLDPLFSKPLYSYIPIFAPHIESLSAVQSFTIELNDMHGKPRSTEVFDKNGNMVSYVKYNYKIDPDHNNKLNNLVDVVNINGKVEQKNMGVDVDWVLDSRANYTKAHSGGINFNQGGIYLLLFIPFFGIMPDYSYSATSARCATSTKVINRYGLLESVEAYDLGSKITTYNKVYDEETGAVVLTQVQNDFNDPIYNTNIPAHWAYDLMGPAYKNIGYTFSMSLSANGNATNVNSTGPQTTEILSHLVLGDELMIVNPPTDLDEKIANSRFYVTEIDKINKKLFIVSDNKASDDNKHCTLALGNVTMKIIRSGRRNMASLPIQNVTSLTNPVKTALDLSRTLNFTLTDQIIASASNEYADNWTKPCAVSDYGISPYNPYAGGTKGNWRLIKNYTFLKDRNQTTTQGKRKDGYYNNFESFWQYDNTATKWTKHDSKWRYVTNITEYDLYRGANVESQDAIGRYDAAMYGYNHTQMLGISTNARRTEILTDGFEDRELRSSFEQNFNFTNEVISTTNSHTGRRSIKVAQGQNGVIFNPASCK